MSSFSFGKKADVRVTYEDGTVVDFPSATMDVIEEIQEDLHWSTAWEPLSLKMGWRLSFETHSPWTFTVPQETKQEKRARLIKEMYPTK